jgi:hypothetical protein
LLITLSFCLSCVRLAIGRFWSHGSLKNTSDGPPLSFGGEGLLVRLANHRAGTTVYRALKVTTAFPFVKTFPMSTDPVPISLEPVILASVVPGVSEFAGSLSPAHLRNLPYALFLCSDTAGDTGGGCGGCGGGDDCCYE